jgi:hypothetical protein
MAGMPVSWLEWNGFPPEIDFVDSGFHLAMLAFVELTIEKVGHKHMPRFVSDSKRWTSL